MIFGDRLIDVRRAAAVSAGKASATASRLWGRGGGTALPGLVATRVHPHLVADLTAQLVHGSVIITGTNGKTTTARLLGQIVTDGGFNPLRNESGSNLMRGLASALVHRARLTGNLEQDGDTLGLFEIDEAALPDVATVVKPRALVLLDLFRDQLDRYGEVASVARLWAKSIAALGCQTQVVANADDPLVTDVSRAAECAPLYFGLDSVEGELQEREHASDVKACPRCGGEIRYQLITLGHLGHYQCVDCIFARPEPQVWADQVEQRGVDGSEFILHARGGSARVRLPLPGLYNVYNAVAAAAAATSLGISVDSIAASLQSATPAFGRMERFRIDGRDGYLALAKNPTGLNQILRTVLVGERALHLMLMLNDNIADGRDVSWIWDVDIELLRERTASVVVSGTRAEDMAVRLKYAGVIGEDAQVTWEIMKETEPALRRAVDLTPEGEPFFVIPTYTALLDVRGVLARLGYLKPYWED